MRAHERRKGFWVAAGLVQALTLVVIALAAAALDGTAAGLVVLVMLALFSLASGAGSVAFGDVKNDLAYRIYDHGEWNVVNPIAREDLAEFIVNQVLNDDAIGRILPVGGPWTADNTVTLKGAGELMFELNGKEPQWEVITMASWDKKIGRLTRLSKLTKQLKPVVFYLEAAKYWSVVDHVAPAYGTRTLKGFMEKLVDREFPLRVARVGGAGH